MKEIIKRQDLVRKLKKWLKKDGIKYFRDIKAKYGRIDAVWMEGNLPHPVHFREGMQIRNFLRQHMNWDSIKLDNQWVRLIEEAIDDSL